MSSTDLYCYFSGDLVLWHCLWQRLRNLGFIKSTESASPLFSKTAAAASERGAPCFCLPIQKRELQSNQALSLPSFSSRRGNV